MLRDTKEKVQTVANAVGYDSLPAFSRAFKRWNGEGPGTFRRKLARGEL